MIHFQLVISKVMDKADYIEISVKALVDMHVGGINVNRSLGEVTEFIIKLPTRKNYSRFVFTQTYLQSIFLKFTPQTVQKTYYGNNIAIEFILGGVIMSYIK